MIDLDKIGAVLTYRHLGVQGIGGQTVGADGAGKFCVIFLGDPFKAETAAHEHAAKLCRCGARTCDIYIVANHEGYFGFPISVIEVGE